MDDRGIRDRIKERMVEKLRLRGLDPAEIDDDASFDWIGLDSVDVLELVVVLGREFAIEVANEDLHKESLGSVAALAALVGRYLAASEPHGA